MPQRSPAIFWLLLAATICVDAVGFSWMYGLQSYSMAAEVALFALIVGQLSAICICSALCPKASIWTYIAPVAAVIASSVVFGLMDVEVITELLPFFGLHAAALLCALWIFRRSMYWRRRSGRASGWQFSIAHLLIAMTVVALLAAAVRHSDLFEEDGVLNFAFLCGSVALAMASVISWSCSGHWLLRLAGVLAIAIGLGAAFYVVDEPFAVRYVISHYLVQAIVLAAWLGWGQIVPIKETIVVAES